MKKTKEYCTLEPIFPKHAYLVFLFMLHKEELLGVIPLESIYTSPTDAAKAIHGTIQQYEIKLEPVSIPYECLLVPLTFQESFPLRKEYWGKSTVNYDYHTRVNTFFPVIECPPIYNLLVTPFAYDDFKKTWYLSAALPVTDIKTKAVERFMYTTDYVVEPRAKNAAFYKMGEKMRFNWQTQTIKPFENHNLALRKKTN